MRKSAFKDGTSAIYNSLVTTFVASVFFCSSCSSSTNYSSGVDVDVVFINPIVPKVEDIALSSESRMTAYLSSEQRLLVVNTSSGEEVWSRRNVQSAKGLIPYSVRDGVVTRTNKGLEIFLSNGGRASVGIEGSHLVGRGTNETQFAVSFDGRSEVVNMLEVGTEAGKNSLPHDENIFLTDPDGQRTPARRTVHTFYSSSTGDQLISLDLLSLKFMQHKATGVSVGGSVLFSPDNYTVCSPADYNLIRDALVKENEPSGAEKRKFRINSAKLPVSYAIDSEYKGLLMKTADGRLIHLDFALACAGANAIKILQTEAVEASGIRNMIVPLSTSVFAVQLPEGRLDVYSVGSSGIEKVGQVNGFCRENIVAFKRYGNRGLFACGQSSAGGERLESVSVLQLVDLQNMKILSETSHSDPLGLAGLAFETTEPMVYLLSNRSSGKLSKFDFTKDTASVEVKSNGFFKNILDRL